MPASAQPALNKGGCATKAMKERYQSKAQIAGSQADGDIVYGVNLMLSSSPAEVLFEAEANTAYSIHVIFDRAPRKKTYPHPSIAGTVEGRGIVLQRQQGTDVSYSLPAVGSRGRLLIKLTGSIYYDLRDEGIQQDVCAIVYIVKPYKQVAVAPVVVPRKAVNSSRVIGSERPGTGETISDDFLDEVITKENKIMFMDWPAAKKAYQWNWLETAKEDPNVHRYFSNNKLWIFQKTEATVWAHADLKRNLPSEWVYGASTDLVKGQAKNPGAGLALVSKSGGQETMVLFTVNPVNQTYWFGTYNTRTREWKTLNAFEGSNYNPVSKFINAYDEKKGMATNSAFVERKDKEIFLYINDRLVETIRIENESSLLGEISGIGVAGSGVHGEIINSIFLSFKE